MGAIRKDVRCDSRWKRRSRPSARPSRPTVVTSSSAGRRGDRRRHRRAGRRLRHLPGVHRHPEGRHRADPEGPGRRRHREVGGGLSVRPGSGPMSRGPLLEAARAGDRAALARLLSLVERGGEPAREVGRLAHPLGGQAYTVGHHRRARARASRRSPAPLIGSLRAQGQAVGVLAIDPSSPFTGGAILGDRVRMHDHATDDGVFIRSMATRGHLGGLSLATPEAVRVLDAAGRPWVSWRPSASARSRSRWPGRPTPPSSSSTRAGVTPCRPTRPACWRSPTSSSSTRPTGRASAETRRDLERMLDLTDLGDWRPPVVAAVATDGTGIADVWSAVERPPRVHREGRPAAAAPRRARRPGAASRSSPSAWRPGPGSCARARPTTSWSARVLDRGSTRGPPPTCCSTASAPERGRRRPGARGSTA